MVGHIKTEDLWDVNEKRLNRYMNKFLPFIKVRKFAYCLDMGEANPKMEIVKKKLGLMVKQSDGIDFNFDKLTRHYNKFDYERV